MSSTGLPSASATSGFVLRVDGVEGQRSGLLFYGVSGPMAAPWASGGTSRLCVAPPVQRTTIQFSAGTLGACDGSFALDWSAFVAANPTALRAPFAAGDVVHAQGWLRDPPAPRTSNLSNAFEFVLCQ